MPSPTVQLETKGLMMLLKPGMRLRSASCSTELIVVKSPAGEVELCCGGVPVVTADQPVTAVGVPEGSTGCALGKRYADDDLGIELLCTKPGAGDLTCNGAPLGLKGSKQLPSSD